MLEGLRLSGCRIIFSSCPDKAPFVITFETRSGERMGVVAYAFLATRTPTRNRPADERSFQLKYGSKDAALHTLWQDPLGLFTTLLVGIDPREGFFVAADPELHSPTRLFIRLEFKDGHAELIKRDGWHAWERASRRRDNPAPDEHAFLFETLVGGRQDRFLDLIRFERAAKCLPPGDRHLLAEKPEGWSVADATGAVLHPGVEHPLARELELSSEQILEVIANARRLKMAVRGWVAEEKLRDALLLVPGVTRCEKVDAEGGPDVRVWWRDASPVMVECKNVLRKTTAAGEPRIDFQRTRAAKSDPCSRYYAPSDFEVLAGCLHAVTERWEFRFVLPGRLPQHKSCSGKLASNVVIGKDWTADAASILDAACAAR